MEVYEISEKEVLAFLPQKFSLKVFPLQKKKKKIMKSVVVGIHLFLCSLDNTSIYSFISLLKAHTVKTPQHQYIEQSCWNVFAFN